MELDRIIETVASKHGVILSKDDPILILHTYLELFKESLADMQEEERCKLIQLLEIEQQKWLNESKNRAERILSASLKGAQNRLQEHHKKVCAETITAWGQTAEEKMKQLEAMQCKMQWLAIANMISAGLLVIAVLFYVI